VDWGKSLNRLEFDHQGVVDEQIQSSFSNIMFFIQNGYGVLTKIWNVP
jgi:hypothetical protein